MTKPLRLMLCRLRPRQAMVLFPLILFVFLAGFNIASPGLYYDELLFVNAALGGKTDMFISLRLGSLPLLLMPYIGALKAWIYYPIFKIFGVTAYSIRWPVVLIGALTLFINYRFVKMAFSPSVAIIFLFLAVVEPSTLYHTRLDWGPTTLMMLLRGLFLLSLLAWIKTGRPWLLFAVCVIAVVGVFDKLNFIWMVLAAAISLLIFYPDRVLVFVRLHRRSAIFVILLLGVCSAVFLYYIKNYLPLDKEIINLDWALRLRQVAAMLHGTIGGTGVYGFVIGNGRSMASVQLLVLSLTGIVALLVLVVTRKIPGEWRLLGFILCFILITFLQMFITRQATGPHHAAMLAPLWLIPIAVLLGQAFEPGNYLGRVLKSAATLSIVVLVVSSLLIDTAYLKGLRGPVNNQNWDAGSYDLVKVISTHQEQPIICVDWGSATIIYGLLNGNINVIDNWSTFKEGLTIADAKYYEQGILQKNPLFILRAAGKEVFPETRKHFFEIASSRSWNVNKLTTIKGAKGSALYEIYEIRTNS